MYDYEEEEDELQLLLEGRADGDDDLVKASLKGSSKKTKLKAKQSDKSQKKNSRRSANLSEDEDKDDNDAYDDMADDDDRLSKGDEDEPMAQYENEFDEDEDDGHPKFDEAVEVPESAGKGKKDAGSATKKKIVRNPRIILNEDMLKHVDGVVALPGLFKKIKFKGKGHERDDLNTIMSTYERWAHKLMPSLQFDDFIEKAETVTRKAKMKTFLTKIRNNLTLDVRGGAADFINPDQEPDMPSDNENFEPISYFPEKEYSFSDDDAELFAGISQAGLDPVADSKSQETVGKAPATKDDDSNDFEPIQYESNDVEMKENEDAEDANVIARTKRRALILEDDSDDEVEDKTSKSNENKPNKFKSREFIASEDDSSRSSSISTKRKRLNEKDDDDSSQQSSASSVESNDSEQINVKTKRRKLVINEDDDDENEGNDETNQKEVTASEVSNQELLKETFAEQSDKPMLDTMENNAESNQVTEDEFLALLNS